MPDLKNTLGAFHVSELFFVFGNEVGRLGRDSPRLRLRSIGTHETR